MVQNKGEGKLVSYFSALQPSFVLRKFPPAIGCTFVESLQDDAREWGGGKG